MAHKYLSREDAPIEAKTWEMLDRTMIAAAKNVLAGRRILEIEGPFGLGLKAVPLSDPMVESAPVTGGVLPLALIVRDFTLSKRDLAAFERDGVALDTKEIALAAIEAANLEDDLIFRGTKETPGLLAVKGSSQLKLSSWDTAGNAAVDIIQALTSLDYEGFHGPYALALAPNRYNMLLRMYPNGAATELEHIKTMAADGVFKAASLASGGILLASGRQYASIVLGQDMSLGYIGPQSERLEFSITETLTPYIKAPKAVCVLKE
jgi:uncharacterized linocin/CFP29 family protein